MNPSSALPRDVAEECELYTDQFQAYGCAEANRLRDVRIQAAGCATFEDYLTYLKRIDPVFAITKNGGAQ